MCLVSTGSYFLAYLRKLILLIMKLNINAQSLNVQINKELSVY
ncbi:16424_t:CDS:2, partial [Cetraspora pellucida]